jgi:chromosome partitioning protein
MITIAITNQKGGVGKTTLAFNLAHALSKRAGTKVVAMDNDPQGNLTSSFLEDPSKLTANILHAYDGKNLEPTQVSKNLYFIGSNINLSTIAERDFQVIFKLKEAMDVFRQRKTIGIPYSGRFDYAIIDCLPSFGHLHLAALNAADYVLIPIKLAPYALVGMTDLFETIKRTQKYFNHRLKILGIAINQVDGRKPIIEREMATVLQETYKNLVLNAKINKRVKIEESPAFQKSIIDYDPKGPSAREFKTLTNEILRRIKSIKNGSS